MDFELFYLRWRRYISIWICDLWDGGWDAEEGPTAVTICDIGVSFLKLRLPLSCRCWFVEVVPMVVGCFSVMCPDQAWSLLSESGLE